MKYRRANGRGGEIQEEKKKERKMIVLDQRMKNSITRLATMFTLMLAAALARGAGEPAPKPAAKPAEKPAAPALQTVAPGDRLAVAFHIAVADAATSYTVEPGDELYLNFRYSPALSQVYVKRLLDDEEKRRQDRSIDRRQALLLRRHRDDPCPRRAFPHHANAVVFMQLGFQGDLQLLVFGLDVQLRPAQHDLDRRVGQVGPENQRVPRQRRQGLG